MVASGAADPRRRHGPKKGPANKAGPRGSSCVRVAVWVESPSPPARVPKSRVWNWFHGLFGRAHRLSGAKENAGPYWGARPGKVRRSLIS